MAVVKFLSSKDCQVFIDMELAGKVTSDSMLKVTLEAGGYLIQIKDEDDNLIKEYEMEIKSSDNQLLQKIDGTDNKLDDIIGNLRNDSSLVFHSDRASFCYNGLYGFVDKKFNVVIPPIYYSVNEFTDDKAFVVRDFPEGRKTTMIDSDGNMFFNRWFDYIGESDETILFGIDDRIIVYSKMKCDKIIEYYNAGYDHKVSLVPVYKKEGDYNFFGYIDYDGKEVIPFIFNNVGNFNEKGEADVNFLGREVTISTTGYYQEGKDGCYYKTSWNGDLQGLDGIFSEKMPCPCCYDTGETRWQFIPIWNNYKWIIKVTIRRWHQEIKSLDYCCDYVLRIDNGFIICKQADKVLVLIANIYNDGVEEFTFDADDVEPVFDIHDNLQGDDIITSRTFVIKKDNKYGVYNTLGEELIPVEFDEITPSNPYEFAIRKGSKYGMYVNGNLSTIIYDNVLPLSRTRGYLLEKDGKYGLWTDKNGLQPVYDNIENCGVRNIVSIADKFGIIDNEGNEILPLKFDKILLIDNYYFKVKDSNGWSLGYLHHGNIYIGTYDDITLLSKNDNETWFNDVFSVKKNGKYGCIDNNGKILIPIEYKKIELNSTFYNPRMFSLLLYKGNKVGFYECSFDDDYRYIVKPSFDNCVLLKNKKSVLTNFLMHYAAVQKDGKWGILDQKPRKYTYYAIVFNLRSSSQSNLKDLEFKYDSIEELMEDADNEFQRRYEHYYCPWIQLRDENGKYCIYREDEFIV